MKPLQLGDIVKVTSGLLLWGDPQSTITGISHDSRNISPGDLFIALSGDRFDGHKFLGEVAAKGARAALVSRIPSSAHPSLSLIQVEDTLLAMGALGSEYRRAFPIPLVAITGSNGKTTTKEMVSYLLSKAGPTLATWGNYNNAIGVPLNLFRLTEEYQHCVLEMGASDRGEIRYLAQMARPTIGVITNISAAHLEGFGSLKGVQAAKGELAEELGEGPLVINGDDPLCRQIGRSHRGPVLTFGLEDGVDLKGWILRQDTRGTWLAVDDLTFLVPLLGRHNVYNALAALGVLRTMGLSEGLACDWEDFSPPSLRMEKIEEGGITFIKDCYNANPGSLEAALSALSSFPTAGKKILVLGDMLELGEDSVAFHWKMGRRAYQLGVDFVMALGKEAFHCYQSFQKLGGKGLYLESHEEVARELRNFARPADVVLLKGSRGVGLEKVWEFWNKKVLGSG